MVKWTDGSSIQGFNSWLFVCLWSLLKYLSAFFNWTGIGLLGKLRRYKQNANAPKNYFVHIFFFLFSCMTLQCSRRPLSRRPCGLLLNTWLSFLLLSILSTWPMQFNLFWQTKVHLNLETVLSICTYIACLIVEADDQTIAIPWR